MTIFQVQVPAYYDEIIIPDMQLMINSSPHRPHNETWLDIGVMRVFIQQLIFDIWHPPSDFIALNTVRIKQHILFFNILLSFKK